jgi:type IX secretion system PorP/SprF family membrane protein
MFKKLWAGFEGAPSMQYLTGHMNVADNMGVGAQIFNMSSGLLSRTGFTGTYAYHVPLNGNGDRLAFGLSGKIHQYRIDLTNQPFENDDDPLYQSGADRKIVPDATFGTYYYTENYYAGLSISNLFSKRHYYLQGGYNLEVNSDLSLEPSLMLKLIEAGVLQADINVLARYQDMFWGGLSFRPASALAVLAGYQSSMVSIGYSYDINLTDIGRNSFGSHEILLMFRLKNFLSIPVEDTEE